MRNILFTSLIRVIWLVLKEELSASKAQIAHFANVMHHPNNRPVQPTNARVVLQ